jgi:predicted XRE-type DNA-binding protein
MNTEIMSENASLSDLRKHTPNIKQSVVALQMNINESAVSKLERKRLVDASIAKARRYIEAIGGELVLTIKLPDGQEMTI